jgi:predicted transcriptional regulator
MVDMRRTRYEIMIDILTLCKAPRRITEIVYSCNLNFRIIKNYLSCLLEKGWMKEENKVYILTESGFKTLEALHPAMTLITACLT